MLKRRIGSCFHPAQCTTLPNGELVSGIVAYLCLHHGGLSSSGEQLITTDPYALADSDPFSNSLSENLEIDDIYNDRGGGISSTPRISAMEICSDFFRKAVK